MNSSQKLLIQALKKELVPRAPFWFMRQAGRYLPEYKALRSKAKNFLEFCYTPEMAVEATLQPIQRFGMDGAILFSDILVIPDALGVEVRFEEGHGPLLKPVDEKTLPMLGMDRFDDALSPVYEALRLTKKKLPAETALIGFVGAPWTLACYMVQGKSDREFKKVRSAALAQPEFFSSLIVLLTDAVARHAVSQIEAGAEAIQMFDSWAGCLSEKEFSQWSIAPAKKIVQAIRKKHPHVPVIGFPRLAGSKYADYAEHTGVDAVNIDGSVSLEFAKKTLQPRSAVQGNLDPLLLAENKEVMLAEARRIISAFGGKSFVFNLGHGILPHTPIEHVESLCHFLKSHE